MAIAEPLPRLTIDRPLAGCVEAVVGPRSFGQSPGAKDGYQTLRSFNPWSRQRQLAVSRPQGASGGVAFQEARAPQSSQQMTPALSGTGP